MPDVLTLTDAQRARIAAGITDLPKFLQPVAEIYIPALTRMILANANASLAKVVNGIAGVTPDTLRDYMSQTDLEVEKTTFNALFVEMANDSYAAKQALNKVVNAVLTMGVNVALTAAFP